MKPVRFLGSSLKDLRDFPGDARQDVGRQLDRLQRGMQPEDFKPMPSTAKASRKFECGTTPAPFV